MTTKRKVKKAAARRERIRLEKAARKAMCSAERSAERERQRVFKDIKTFFNEIADESADLIYRKEQIKAGLIGEIRRIRILKDKDPDKYAKLSTKIYEDCVAKIDNKIQPDLVKLAGLIDKFKDHPNAGDSSLTSSFEASELLGDIASGLNEIVDTAEGLYHQVDDTVAGIENPETNPIAEEAKQQTDSGSEGTADSSSAETPAAETSEVKVEDAANDAGDPVEAMEADFTPETDLVQIADRTPESLPLADVTEVIPDEIEADPDALNKIIDAQADSKSDVVVKLEDITKPAESLPEPPKEVIVDVNSIPEINMTDTNQNTAASGNTFDDQEVDIVATPAAAKGNTNADQETSVDADTVNKILNEQNNTSQA